MNTHAIIWSNCHRGTTTNAFFQMGGSANQKAAIIFYSYFSEPVNFIETLCLYSFS